MLRLTFCVNSNRSDFVWTAVIECICYTFVVVSLSLSLRRSFFGVYQLVIGLVFFWFWSWAFGSWARKTAVDPHPSDPILRIPSERRAWGSLGLSNIIFYLHWMAWELVVACLGMPGKNKMCIFKLACSSWCGGGCCCCFGDSNASDGLSVSSSASLACLSVSFLVRFMCKRMVCVQT